jgi:hypothetical protein
MLRKILLATTFVLAAVSVAQAQPVASPTPAQAAPAYQGTQASCQAYEARMRRQAQLVKGLGANYNPQRVLNDCMANPSLAAQ